MFQKFLRIQRRETGSSAAEGPAEPDSGLTELQAEPDVSLDSAELSQDLDTTIYEDGENGDEALAQVVAITNAKSRGTEATTNTCTMPIPTVIHAATMEFFEESAVPSQQQVPAIVRNIHQRLLSHDTVDARLQIDIVRLAEEHPPDVVLTLLRCAPTCDGFAVQTMKAQLYRLQCDKEVMAVECKRGWDTLLCAHTQHYAVGLLAR
ncbi:uncharacterized protein LOC135309356 [Passer domesticus]|uniref:uncharacterized protein LOC135309356 n=1 Tax=Passer domesticus TaxID=48849 RepID=UPI0030FEF136